MSNPEKIEMTDKKSNENIMKGGFFKSLSGLSQAANAKLKEAHGKLQTMAAPHIEAAKQSEMGKQAATAAHTAKFVAALPVGAAMLGATVAKNAVARSETGQKAAALGGVLVNHANAAVNHAAGLYNTHKDLKGMSNTELEQHVINSQTAFDRLVVEIREDISQGTISQAEGNALISSITAIHDTHMKIAKSKMTKQKTAGGRKTKRHHKKKRARTRKAHKRRSHKRRKPKRKPSRRVNKKHTRRHRRR